ncbi:alpha/beta hydrolase [Aeromonas lusitana]|uniref:Alpha/beta hydrolase n=1 Tax=Aeromonas lusitana TaxID=931529 RepID=A0A2M8H7N6_9GAMM|nr:alpha/beta hydrolase [Aeromonas lusitana]PJC92584.1 alpha/beta hydrolase [Aeromonas lusitana]
MNEQPKIVLVHGFWGGAAHWHPVITRLLQKGFTQLQAVELPLTSLAEDAERVRKMVAQHAGPVLLVGHSYGGAVISEMGDMPNVVGLVYIAAFAPDAGESAGGITQVHPPVAIASIAPDSDGYLWIKQSEFHASFCQDLTPLEAQLMAICQKAPLGSTFGNEVQAPAWKKKPSWYQISSEDRMINPENQQRMAARMQPRQIITLAASHASLVSKADEVSNLIASATQGR